MSGDDYDPVKARSGFLSSYMSGHKDTIVAYVMHFGKINGHIVNAKMASIDQNKMDLSYQLQEDGKWMDVSVAFDPPLSGYEEVKPRLLQMKEDAEEGLGMAKAPPLTTFTLKPSMFNATPVLLILLVLSIAPYENHTISKDDIPTALHPYLPTINSANHTLTNIRQALPFTPNTAYVLWASIGVIHVALALLVAFFSFQRKASFRIGIAWILSTLLLSYPAVFEFRSHLQTARIKSIGKHK
ncbi:hypothetical protein FRC19_008770 [Serendipita sp. 401]|nr:hypothetical protein FRC19_008770 [Serendipita sp. 401]